MEERKAKRKLTAILSADVKGYSRLMQDDEEATVRTITAYREVMSNLIQGHDGRVVDAKGDNLLAEFPSVVDAVRCGIEIQNELKLRNAELPEQRRMDFRIGINLGDVIEEEETIYGDGVNIAARLEGLAAGGGICISRTAFDQIKNKLDVGYQYLGEHSVKNIAEPVRVYKVLMEPEYAGKVIGEERPKARKWRWAAIGGVLVLIIVAGILVVWHHYIRLPFEPASVEKMAFPLPDKPSIAVLPFANMSDDPEQEYFSDGLTEDLITEISRFSGVFVISRNSVFLYKGKAVKPRQVSEELGVRYVLEGSVRKSGEKVRITAQLIDAISGGHLWAERYDRELKDIFDVQDEITQQIVAALDVKVTKAEQARAFQKDTSNMTAFDYNLRGWWYYQLFTREANATARLMFKKAIELEPDFAPALAGLGFTYYEEWASQWSQDPQSLERAFELGKKARAIDELQVAAYVLLSHVYLWRKQHEQAITELERAIVLNPNDADLYADLAETLIWVGRPAKALELVRKAMRLNPYPPVNYLVTLGFAYASTGQYEEAIAAEKRALTLNPDHLGSHMILAAIYGELDREEEARSHVTEALRISPHLTLEVWRERLPFKDQAKFESYADAWRKAGLPEHPPLPLPENPSIAVLPFTNMSGDPDQEYFSDGMTEDLITDLSKISGLFVIARNSVFAYKGKSVKIEQVGRDLGVRYILEGSVRKSGDKVRINAQLVDSETGGHVWAERYDGDLKDIFALQDEVIKKIVTALVVKLTDDEQERLVRKGTDSLEAYDCTLRGDEYFFRLTKDANVQAQKMYRKAIALDPNYAPAHLGLGWTYWMGWSFGWSQDPQSLKRAFELGQKAISLDDSLFKAHALLGKVYLWKKQHDQAIAELEKTITLNTNYADGLAGLGEILYFAGRPEEAIGLIKKAMRLNPKYPVWYLLNLGHAYFLAGHYQEAIAALKRVLTRNPSFWPAHVYLAASYFELGHVEEAQARAAEILKINPNFSLEAAGQRLPYKDRAVLEHLGDTLHKVGLK